MKTVTLYVAGCIGIFALITGLTWAVQGNDFYLYKTFAPKYEQTRRETFEQSKAYNEGMAQELRRMQSEYIRAKPEQKAALRSVIVHQFAGYIGVLPPDLHVFITELQQQNEVY